jgi:hypothetical protein
MKAEHLLKELDHFFEPFAAAMESPDAMGDFLRRFGVDPSKIDSSTLLNELNAGNPSLPQLFQQVVSGSRAFDAAFLRTAFEVLRSLNESSVLRESVPNLQMLGDEMFALLARRYLGTRFPTAIGALEGLGVLTEKEVAPENPGGRHLPYVRVSFDWAVLGQFVRQNPQWAFDVYGWGGKPPDGPRFDYEKAISAVVRLAESTQLALAHEREMKDSERNALLKNSAGQPAPKAAVPIIQEEPSGFEEDGEPMFSTEVGLNLLPYGDINKPEDLGLALAPYAKGAAEGERDLTDRLTLGVTVESQATGGAYLTVTPQGVDIANGTAVEAGFEFSFDYGRSDKDIVLIGEPDSTRLQAAAIAGALGGDLNGDIFAAGGVEGFRAVIDVSQDGLLGKVIPDPIDVDAGTVLIGWRPGRGVYFEGGTSLEVEIPLEIDLEVVRILGLTVALDWAEALNLETRVEGELEIGPLFARADGIGVRATVVNRPGVLGRRDLDFGFVPPIGYAVSLDVPALTGGGLVEDEDEEYRGALSLTFQTFGISAFAILDTQLPGGREGFSFAASIFGEFNAPLGFGFFLTGVGGVVGINRTVDTKVLRSALYEGRFDNLLFPEDPIENADSILETMAEVLPGREGQHLFGPVARIGWGQPMRANVTLGVVIEVGDETRILILGGMTSDLPSNDAAVVALELSFFGEIDFAEQTLAFDATLKNSRIVTYTVNGEVAIRSGWGERGPQIASFGGLHPKFPRPPSLSDLKQISIAFGSNNPRVSVGGYCALTLNTIQFGARAELYVKGPDYPIVGQLAAEGFFEFDALITYQPFGFVVSLAGGISLLREGNEVLAINFDVTFSGPNRFKIDGKVWGTALGQDIKIPIKASWGSEQTLPPPQVDAVAALQEALERTSLEPAGGPGPRVSAVSHRTPEEGEAAALDPLGGARLNQTAVPLRVTLDKIGEAEVSGPRTLDVELREPGGAAFRGETRPVRSDFVRDHFFKLSGAERLRGTAFDNLVSGLSLKHAWITTSPGDAIEAEYKYERIHIPAEQADTAPAPGRGVLTPNPNLLGRLELGRRMENPAIFDLIQEQLIPEDVVRPREPRFVVQPEVEDAFERAGGGGIDPNSLSDFGSLADADASLGRRPDRRLDVTVEGDSPRSVAFDDRSGTIREYVAEAADLGRPYG